MKLNSSKNIDKTYLDDETEIGDIAKLVINQLNYIEEKKQYENDLKYQNEQLQAIFDTSRYGIAIMDLTSKYQFFNKSYLEMTGYLHDELMHKSCKELSKNADDYLIDELLKKGLIENKEKVCVTKDGREIIVNVNMVLMPNKNQILLSARDITEFKMQETLLKEQEEVIVHQSKMASLGEMITNIAHQWRQPLSHISTISSGLKLQKAYGVLNDEILVQDLDKIIDVTKYLSNIIDDFRKFISNDLNCTDFSINQTIQNACKYESIILENNKIKLVYNLLESDITILGYQNGLLQCLNNLIKNANDALLKNESLSEKLIFLNAQIVDSQIEIEIKDNGGGIPEEIISKVFEPYFTTKHKSQGTGMSLYMNYKIIFENFGGYIKVKNTLYEYNQLQCLGASFKIYIPLKS